MIIPLVDEGQYWGFVAIGGAKRSFAKDAGHDLLVNIARTVASTYRRHFDMTAMWAGNGGQFDRLRAAGEMIAGIAHGFNNSLAAISAYAQLIRTQSDLAATADLARRIDRSVADATQMVRRVQGLVEGSKAQTETVRISDIVQQSVDITRPKWETEALVRGVTIALRIEL